MFKMQPLYLLLSVLLISVNVFSQCPFNTKFGKIVPEDFSFHSSFIDSGNNAGAVILFDIGSNEFESNNVGGMRTVFNKHTRIKILNKNGYNAATVRNVLYRYSKEYEEDLINLKASTFILESNVVKEYKLDRKNDLNTNVTGNYFEDVFTLPSIKEGAIIEFSYTIKSDIYSNVHSWYFQGIYPVIYTQYSVLIPEFLKFNFDIKPFVDLDVTRKTEVFNIVFDTKEGFEVIYL